MTYRLNNSPDGRLYKIVDINNGFIRFDDGSIYTEKDIIEKFKAIDYTPSYEDDSNISIWIDEDIPTSIDREQSEKQVPKIEVIPVVTHNGNNIPLSTLEKARKFKV